MIENSNANVWTITKLHNMLFFKFQEHFDQAEWVPELLVDIPVIHCIKSTNWPYFVFGSWNYGHTCKNFQPCERQNIILKNATFILALDFKPF